MSFFTITLPNLGKDFEKSLAQGRIDNAIFRSFSKSGSLPSFLKGFFCLVFDPGTGILLEDPSIDAISSIRQITLMFGKISFPCSENRVRRAISGYLQCERELDDHIFDPIEIQGLKNVFIFLFADICNDIDDKISAGYLSPSHGPGSTAERVLGNDKFNISEWTQRLERVFPFMDYALTSYRYHDMIESVQFHEPGSERPVRVITVPKTLKTPRIIAIEPTCMQYMQQGISRLLVDYIERDENISIGFLDQLPNQQMAKSGSALQDLATLDLSEASDRVSNRLVSELFSCFPSLHEGIQACRSSKADVPGYGKISLTKFASMGSALCFPVEAMVFYSIIFYSIAKSKGYYVGRPLPKFGNLSTKVRVYGDDIIVPVDYVSTVIDNLESFGFKVNHNKSFWTGKFRESCGKEYYDGSDVSIVRVRTDIPSMRQQVKEVLSTVSLRNQLYSSGYWTAAGFLDDVLRKVLVHFPIVEDTSPLLGRVSFSFESFAEKIDPNTHNPMVKGWRVFSLSPINPLDDHGALLKFFLNCGDEPLQEGHLERAGRPDAVNIKLGYGVPF
jgi:hypothetical protein